MKNIHHFFVPITSFVTTYLRGRILKLLQSSVFYLVGGILTSHERRRVSGQLGGFPSQTV